MLLLAHLLQALGPLQLLLLGVHQLLLLLVPRHLPHYLRPRLRQIPLGVATLIPSDITMMMVRISDYPFVGQRRLIALMSVFQVRLRSGYSIVTLRIRRESSSKSGVPLDRSGKMDYTTVLSVSFSLS